MANARYQNRAGPARFFNKVTQNSGYPGKLQRLTGRQGRIVSRDHQASLETCFRPFPDGSTGLPSPHNPRLPPSLPIPLDP